MEFCSKFFVSFFVASALAVSCFAQKETVVAEEGHVPYGIGKLTWAEYNLLKDSVQYIVGPHAPVSAEILAFAETQPGVPRNLYEMMAYMPFYFLQADQIGIRRVPGAYNKGIENPANRDKIIYQRAAEWLANNGYDVRGIGNGAGNGNGNGQPIKTAPNY